MLNVASAEVWVERPHWCSLFSALPSLCIWLNFRQPPLHTCAVAMRCSAGFKSSPLCIADERIPKTVSCAKGDAFAWSRHFLVKAEDQTRLKQAQFTVFKSHLDVGNVHSRGVQMPDDKEHSQLLSGIIFSVKVASQHSKAPEQIGFICMVAL